MAVKKVAAALVAVALGLLLLAPAAIVGVKFRQEDVESDESLWKLYEVWGAQYKVARSPDEKLWRFANFKKTARHVYGTHLRAPPGERPLALNLFADLSDKEIDKLKCRRTSPDDDDEITASPPMKFSRRGGGTLPTPVAIDWRAANCKGMPCVPPVKKQGNCGSCWAFAATAAMEAHNAIRGTRDNNRRGMGVELSEQEILDCDTTSSRCQGGLAVHAFSYVMKHGVASSTSYPYRERNGTCHAATTPRVDLVMRGFERVPSFDEYTLLQAVSYGPLVVSIAVGEEHNDFEEYKGGLYRGPCGTVNDHELLLVGYNYNSLILQNSYGEEWGDEGYMFLSRDSAEACGLLIGDASYPSMGI